MDTQEYNTKVTEEDIANDIKDVYGCVYSRDVKRLLNGSFDIISYIVKEGTEVICAEAFHDFPNSSSLQSIVVSKGKKEYFESILEEEYHHLLKEVV